MASVVDGQIERRTIEFLGNKYAQRLRIRLVDAGAMVEGPLPKDVGSFFAAGPGATAEDIVAIRKAYGLEAFR